MPFFLPFPHLTLPSFPPFPNFHWLFLLISGSVSPPPYANPSSSHEHTPTQHINPNRLVLSVVFLLCAVTSINAAREFGSVCFYSFVSFCQFFRSFFSNLSNGSFFHFMPVFLLVFTQLKVDFFLSTVLTLFTSEFLKEFSRLSVFVFVFFHRFIFTFNLLYCVVCYILLTENLCVFSLISTLPFHLSSYCFAFFTSIFLLSLSFDIDFIISCFFSILYGLNTLYKYIYNL